MDWQEKALALSFGQSRKVKHCGSDASAYIGNSHKGIRINCLRCGLNDFKHHTGLSFQDRMRMRKATQELRGFRVRPDTVPLAKGPPEAWRWVLQAGLTPERATADYGIEWIPRYDRVCVPILERGVDTGGWLARSVDGSRPKYVASASAKGRLWISSPNGAGLVVIVEDILSAIAVDRAGFMAVAAMGTAFSPRTVVAFGSECRTIVPWLDPDNAGAKGVGALRKAASLFPITVTPAIRSERDPKRHSRDEIRRYIESVV